MTSKEIKLYKVEFNEYTNACNNTIYSSNENKYIDIPSGGLLIIREDEFDYYKTFGNGFKVLIYVGSLIEYDK